MQTLANVCVWHITPGSKSNRTVDFLRSDQKRHQNWSLNCVISVFYVKTFNVLVRFIKVNVNQMQGHILIFYNKNISAKGILDQTDQG